MSLSTFSFAHSFFFVVRRSSGLSVIIFCALCGIYPVPIHAQQSEPRSLSVAQRDRVVIVTDTLKVTFDTEGGSLVRTEFLKVPSNVQLPRNLVVLDDSRERVYLAQTGLIGNAKGDFPNHKTLMTFNGDRFIRDGATDLTVTFEAPVVNGVKLVKTYTFQRGSYVLDVNHTVTNVSLTPISPSLYLQIVRDGNREPPSQQSKYATFIGPAVYSANKKYQRVEFHEIETGNVDIERSSPYGYVAMVQHYFASAWLLGDGIDRDYFVRKVAFNLYSVGMITPLKDIAPGATTAVKARFFIGPRVESVTTPLRLEAVQDDGWLLNLLQKLKS